MITQMFYLSIREDLQSSLTLEMRMAWVYLYPLMTAGERALWYGAEKNKGNNNIRN